jgi:hypothetical protein
VPPAQAASLVAIASSTTLARRSAWCRAISVTTDPPLCIPAAVALRADLQRPEKLGILVLRIGVVQMRSGQKLIRPDVGEGAMRLRIPQVTRHGPSWGAGWWGAGRLAACHCCLQHPNLAAIKAGPFHHAAITERPQHVSERTPLSGRRPSLPAVRSRASARHAPGRARPAVSCCYQPKGRQRRRRRRLLAVIRCLRRGWPFDCAIGRQLGPGSEGEQGTVRAERPARRRNGALCLPEPVGAVVFNSRARRPWTNRGPATRDRRA